MNRQCFRASLGILFFALLLLLSVPVRAGGPVTLTVTDCSNDTDLRTKLNEMDGGQGGTLLFSCGNTTTITISSQLPTITTDTTIDGGGHITLSGANSVRLLAVNNTGILTLKNIILEKGYGSSTNGAAISSTGRLALDHTTIRFSTTPFDGGAIFATGRVDLTNSTIANNIATNGAGIYASGVNTEVNITNSILRDNTAGASNLGGAVFTEGSVRVNNGEFANNKAGSAGAIFARHLVASATSLIQNSSFHDNRTLGAYPNANGGALLTDNMPFTISKTSFTLNTGQSGGAIYVMPNGQMTLTDSTLSSNNATNGGGIYNKGITQILAGTLSANSGSHGGGIDNFGQLYLTNVTLSANQATYGGGLKNEGTLASLINVTLSGNSGASNAGGGILHQSGGNIHLMLKNVLVANSSAGGNCKFNQVPDTAIYSLSSDATCGFGSGHDSVNLLLAPLANNGGPTQTHLPQAGSPAINNGTDDAPQVDQRGIPRPQGAAFDVGAVETCAKPAVPVLLKPGNTKRVKGPAIQLDWTDTICVAKYKVIIKLGSQTGALVQKKGGLTTSAFTTQPLTKGQTYAWQVKACRPSLGCAKSAWWTFRVK